MRNLRLAIFTPLLILMALTFNNCSSGTKGSSSAQTTGEQNKHIPVNTGTGWSDSPFVSRDGKRLYFMYSRYNYAPWIKSGGSTLPTLTGPDREGLHHSANPFDESDIYMSTQNADGTWSEAVNLGLNGPYGDASGMEINNGSTFIWLQGNGTTNNIVMANRNTDGTWGTPVDLGPGVNDHSTGVLQDNPYLSADGKALFFTSNRASGSGGKDIWFSSLQNGNWSAPVNVGAPINSAGDEDQMWISSVAQDIYWNGPNGIMHCLSNGATCSSAPTTVTIPGCYFPAEASLPDDGKTIYFGCVDQDVTHITIMYSKKLDDGTWGPATPVD